MYGSPWLEVTMQLVKEYRLRAAMCRAQALTDVRNSRIWLEEAKSWTNKADEEIASHLKECNATSSSDLVDANAA
jgi:hypothetical protein